MLIFIIFGLINLGLYLFSYSKFAGTYLNLKNVDENEQVKIEKEYKKSFSLYSLLASVNIVSFIAFILFVSFFLSQNISCEDMLSSKYFIVIGIPSAILTCILGSFFIPKYSNLPIKFKESQSNLLLLLIASIIFMSINLSFIFINITNNLLNFSYEEKTVKIVSRDRSSSGKSYYFRIEPPVIGLQSLQVTPFTFSDSTKKNHLKIRVYSGLYGIHYVGKNMKIVD